MLLPGVVLARATSASSPSASITKPQGHWITFRTPSFLSVMLPPIMPASRRRKVGEWLASPGPLPRLRLYLTAPLCVEWGGRVLTERDLPSRQARVLLTFLACERARPVSRDSLAELLWPGTPPPSWDTSLKALISKLRPFTADLAPRGSSAPVIHGQYGCYQLELPRDASIYVEAARAALDEAEGALRRGCPQVRGAPSTWR